MFYWLVMLRIKIATMLLSLAEKTFPTEIIEGMEPKQDVYITDVLEEPILLTDMPDEDIPEGVYYDETTAMIECRLLIDGELTIKPVYTTFDHAYELQKHFRSSIEPIKLDWG